MTFTTQHNTIKALAHCEGFSEISFLPILMHNRMWSLIIDGESKLCVNYIKLLTECNFRQFYCHLWYFDKWIIGVQW